VSTDAFQAAQDRYFETADGARYRWTTEDRAFAPAEDALLEPRLAELPFPCLEIGCGEGTNLARLVRRGAPVGIDRYPDKVRFAAHAVGAARLAVADAETLPFADGAFAGVLIRDLLHHLADPRRTTAEAARVLAPGGRLLLLEPNDRNPLVSLQARLIRPEAGLRDFTPDTVLELLRGLPLADVQLEMAQPLPLRRLVLHYRYGWPALGRTRAGARLLENLERLGGRLIPRLRWAYTVIRARRT
jgi:SAM-dependent methyltransferase